MAELLEVFSPIAGYVFVTTITPGPNNLMLSASGRHFGYRKTVPHLLGIALGFTSLLSVCASGFGGMASTAAALVSREGYSPFESAVLLSLAFLVIGVACNHLWALSGVAARRWLSVKPTRTLFNLALLGMSAYAIFSVWRT